jgi:glycogen(starch) synthase
VGAGGVGRGSLESILIIGNNYPPYTLGGYELLCRDHVAWLRSRGHQVTVLVSTFGLPDRRRSEETGPAGERIVRALDFHWKNFEIRRPRGIRLVEGERRQRRVLEGLLREEQPDAIQLWHMAAISKALIPVIGRSGIPTIAVVGESWPVWDIETDAWFRMWRHGRRRDRIARPVIRSLASRLIAPVGLDGSMERVRPAYCSDFLRRSIEERLDAWRGRGVTVRNGIDMRAMARPRDANEPVGRPIRLLFCGRVERRKGVATAIEGLAHLRRLAVPAVLDIVGWRDEDFAAELRESIARLGIEKEVRWLEPVARERLPDVYRDHDVVLFPSIWEEPFGLVALEAMATGCLVVGTGTGGSGEVMLDGQTALLHPVEDAAALARQVQRLSADPPLVAGVRESGRRMAEEHDIEQYHQALLRLVRDEAGARA